MSACAAAFPSLEAATISVESATTMNFTSAGTGPSGAFATDYLWNPGTSTYTSPNDGRFVEGVTLTFNIDPGVTVSGGRYFIGSTDNTPNAITVGPAIWNITGGGEMRITRTGTFNLRLGQNGAPGGTPASEAGQLVVSGGSSLVMTTGAMQEQPGSLITLNGVGSSFTATGTWDAINNRFTGQTSGTAGVLNSGAINFAFSGSGVTGINAVSNAGVVTLTAVPEPASALLGGIGLLALLRRRRA